MLTDVRRFRQGEQVAAVAPIQEEFTTDSSSASATGDLADLGPLSLAASSAGTAGGYRQKARDWAATMFRRHAPQFVTDLQSTAQQVDGAVAEYERRRSRLAKLVAEGRAILADLSCAIETNQQRAATSEKQAESAASEHERQAAVVRMRECSESVASLRRQHVEQGLQVEDLEQQLTKADATLARLRSQRDLLEARLKALHPADESRRGLSGVAGSPSWQSRVAVGSSPSPWYVCCPTACVPL